MLQDLALRCFVKMKQEGHFPDFRGAGSQTKFQTSVTVLTWAWQSLPEEHQLLEPSSLADPGNQEAAGAVAPTAPSCTV